ncbi:MAG TPA: hypothetical protein VIO95_11825 [Mycobacterium sp.]
MRRKLASKAGRTGFLIGAALLVAVVSALAFLTSVGSGSASTRIGTLTAPTIGSAAPGAGTVALSWSAVTPPASGPVTYYVSRNGGAPSGNCPTSTSPASVTSCTDSGLSKGTYSYTVTAMWRTWTATSSPATPANVAFGAAAKLVFTRQPDGSATGGVAFPTQPIVAVEDAGGNIVTTATSTVGLAITAGTGTSGATLSGCNPGTPSGGATTFTGCKIDKAGSNYELHATDGSLTAADSTQFNVSAGPATHLVFTTQPDGSATGGVAFPTQPVVTAEDAGGNPAANYSASVSLKIKSGTAGATLSGCSGTLSNAVTTFSGCKIDKSGTYVLTATDANNLTVDSNSLTVSVGPAAQLAFTQQPDGSATGGVAFPTQPKVAVEDAGGNIVTTDTSTVSLAITAGTGTTGATLSGCTPGTPSGGVTTFSGCKIDRAGSNYQLHATDGTFAAADSNAFTVSVGPASQLVFTQQPDGSATINAPFPKQPIITAEDAGGNTVTAYSKSISLAIATGPAGAALSGCAGSLTNGVDSFSGCQLNTAGSYTLKATDTSSPVLSATSSSFAVSNVSATSVAQAAGPAPTLTTSSISPVSGSTYLIFVYCSGQSSACNGNAAATVTSPAFSPNTAAFVEALGTGSSKDCIELFTATGSSTSGTVTVTGQTNQNIGFVNVVLLSPGAKIQNAGSIGTSHGATSPATASLTNPSSSFGEVVPVGVADGNGATTITVQTPTSGMSLLGTAQQSSTVGADLSVYFDSTAQSSASFALNPTVPLNGWATFAIEVG